MDWECCWHAKTHPKFLTGVNLTPYPQCRMFGLVASQMPPIDTLINSHSTLASGGQKYIYFFIYLVRNDCQKKTMTQLFSSGAIYMGKRGCCRLVKILLQINIFSFFLRNCGSGRIIHFQRSFEHLLLKINTRFAARGAEQ